MVFETVSIQWLLPISMEFQIIDWSFGIYSLYSLLLLRQIYTSVQTKPYITVLRSPFEITFLLPDIFPLGPRVGERQRSVDTELDPIQGIEVTYTHY